MAASTLWLCQPIDNLGLQLQMQGDMSHSMFVLLSGTAGAFVRTPEQQQAAMAAAAGQRAAGRSPPRIAIGGTTEGPASPEGGSRLLSAQSPGSTSILKRTRGPAPGSPGSPEASETPHIGPRSPLGGRRWRVSLTSGGPAPIGRTESMRDRHVLLSSAAQVGQRGGGEGAKQAEMPE
jgi:hypothetical protein